ncbi:MAG: DinB family protein [Chloroflexota bacterium]
MNVPQLAAYALSFSRSAFDEVMVDVTDREANWQPAGIANPIGALYLHTAYDVDAVIHRMFQDRPLLWDEQGWTARLGTSIDMDLTQVWARSVRLEVAAVREYVKAVFDAAEAYVAGLGEADLDRFIPSGMSESTTLGQLLYAFVIWHIDAHCGEVSALKGTLGMQGYGS